MVIDMWEVDPMPVPSTMAWPRHRWVKIKIHCYVCRQCGMCRENGQRENGQWFVTWHDPRGVSHTVAATPPCAVGTLTAKRLKHYEAAIAIADAAKVDA